LWEFQVFLGSFFRKAEGTINSVSDEFEDMAEKAIDIVTDLAGDLKEKGPGLKDGTTEKLEKMHVNKKASDFVETTKEKTRRCYRLG
jgi:hypothetical protein